MTRIMILMAVVFASFSLSFAMPTEQTGSMAFDDDRRFMGATEPSERSPTVAFKGGPKEEAFMFTEPDLGSDRRFMELVPTHVTKGGPREDVFMLAEPDLGSDHRFMEQPRMGPTDATEGRSREDVFMLAEPDHGSDRRFMEQPRIGPTDATEGGSREDVFMLAVPDRGSDRRFMEQPRIGPTDATESGSRDVFMLAEPNRDSDRRFMDQPEILPTDTTYSEPREMLSELSQKMLGEQIPTEETPESNFDTIDGVSDTNAHNDAYASLNSATKKDLRFEGDIIMPLDFLEKRFQLTDKQKKELHAKYGAPKDASEQAANVAHNDLKWLQNTVPYTISSYFNATERRIIQQAINTWQDETCLKFTPYVPPPPYIRAIDHIQFTKQNDPTACDSLIGRAGIGGQPINLNNFDGQCINIPGAVEHEIGHALGLFHEQSRPDRDNYIIVHTDRINPDNLFNFDKQIEKLSDSHGTEYDFKSIMHYPLYAFNKPNCKGQNCYTMEVRNETAYRLQGSPDIGRQSKLSASDIIQVKRLYNCPGSGRKGALKITVRYGQNLYDSYIPLRPYVRLSAVDSKGVEYILSTIPPFYGTKNPVWQQDIIFPNNEWQWFRLWVWEHKAPFADEPMTMSETIPLLERPEHHTNCKHCASADCTRFVMYDYSFITQYRGCLKVKISHATNTFNHHTFRMPSLYVTVIVTKGDGSTATVNTHATNTQFWNQWLNFGMNSYKHFTLQVRYQNTGQGYSQAKEVYVNEGYISSHVCLDENCHSQLYYEYQLISACTPNPCLNGGTCNAHHHCGSYTCTCRNGYYGTRCEYYHYYG